MLKSIQIISIVYISLVIVGCVPTDVSLPANQHKSNFIDQDENSWAKQTNIEEENIDISDIDQEIQQTDMTTLQQATHQVPRIKFPIDEYKKLPKNGKGTIKGSIYLLDLYGQRVYGKHTRLYLNPITSYSKQWYQESYIRGQKMQEADSRLFNYLRFTASDDEGNFAFYGVPNGSYYLIGTVQCAAECGFDTLKSIRIATKIKIQGNQIIQKDLYRQIH